MIVLATRQKNLEVEIRSGTSCSSSANSTPVSGQQRKQITPLALQVCSKRCVFKLLAYFYPSQSKIRKPNDSFDEDKQLKP